MVPAVGGIVPLTAGAIDQASAHAAVKSDEVRLCHRALRNCAILDCVQLFNLRIGRAIWGALYILVFCILEVSNVGPFICRTFRRSNTAFESASGHDKSAGTLLK